MPVIHADSESILIGTLVLFVTLRIPFHHTLDIDFDSDGDDNDDDNDEDYIHVRKYKATKQAQPPNSQRPAAPSKFRQRLIVLNPQRAEFIVRSPALNSPQEHARFTPLPSSLLSFSHYQLSLLLPGCWFGRISDVVQCRPAATNLCGVYRLRHTPSSRSCER